MLSFNIAPQSANSSQDPSLVTKLLDDQNPEKALQECLDISLTFERDEGLEAIIDYHLKNNDLDKAESICSYLTTASSSIRNYKKLFEVYFENKRMAEAKKTALLNPSQYEQNACLEKIIKYYFDAEKFVEVENSLNEISDNSIKAKWHKKIFEAYFNKNEFAHAKRVLIAAPAIKDGDAYKILEHELENHQFIESLTTSKLLGSAGVEKVAEKIKNVKPEESTLIAIEESSSFTFWLFPDLEKIILNSLIFVYQTMNKEEKAQNLKIKIDNLRRLPRFFEHFRISMSFPLAICTGLHAFSAGVPVLYAALLGASVPTIMKYPSILKIQNLLGLGAGIGASLAGYGSATATAAGLGTSLLTRTPVIRKAAGQAANAGISLANTAAKRIYFAANRAVKASEFAIDKGSKGITRAAAKTKQCIEKTIENTGNGIVWVGSLINKLDSALDTISGN